MNNNGAGGPAGGAYNIAANVAPELTVEGDTTRRVKVGQSVTLMVARERRRRAEAAAPTPRRLPAAASGARRTARADCALRGLFTAARDRSASIPDLRSAANQTFTWEDPRPGANTPWSRGWEPPPLPADGRWTVEATFADPGTYVLRAQAHDGGLDTSQDVTFIVEP